MKKNETPIYPSLNKLKLNHFNESVWFVSINTVICERKTIIEKINLIEVNGLMYWPFIFLTYLTSLFWNKDQHLIFLITALNWNPNHKIVTGKFHKVLTLFCWKFLKLGTPKGSIKNKTLIVKDLEGLRVVSPELNHYSIWLIIGEIQIYLSFFVGSRTCW